MNAIEIFLRAVGDGGVELLRIDHGRAAFDAHTASHDELARLQQIAAAPTADIDKSYALLHWVEGVGGRISGAAPQSVVILVDDELDRRGLPLALLSKRSDLLGSDVTQLAAVRLLQRHGLATGQEHWVSETRGGSNEGETGGGRRRRGPHDEYDD